MFKTLMKLSLFAGLAFALPASAEGQLLSRKEVLRGLEAVYVVEDPHEDAMRDGLSTQRLRTVTELALRSAGISVQSAENIRAKRALNPRFRQAYLYVRASTFRRDNSGPYSYHITVGLREMVKLVDGSGTAFGFLWGTSLLGTVGRDNVAKLADESVRPLVEQFANDYLAANPRNQ